MAAALENSVGHCDRQEGRTKEKEASGRRFVHLLGLDDMIAILTISPGTIGRTGVWLSRNEMIDFFRVYCKVRR